MSKATAMSTSRPAKCAVSDDDLRTKYEQMSAKFAERGVRTDAIKDARRYFTGVDQLRHGQEAKLYSQLDDGALPPNAVRLLVLPLDDAPEMSSIGVRRGHVGACESALHLCYQSLTCRMCV
jgi:hypothetical protein